MAKAAQHSCVVDGDRLWDLRQDRGWSQEDLADKAGVSTRTVQHAEAGVGVTLQSVKKLGAALGVKPQDLLKPGSRAPAQVFDEERCSAETLRTALAKSSHGAARFCAFIAGDFSILSTKRALLLPVDAHVHVAVAEAKRTTADVWFPDGGNRWERDTEADAEVTQRLGEHLVSEAFCKHFPWAPRALRVSVVSEIPRGFAVYEETALAVALARAINTGWNKNKSVKPGDFDELRLAAGLLSGWYHDVSWATLVACSITTLNQDRAFWFDRTADDGIDLVGLYKSSSDGATNADVERNVYPAAKFWTVKHAPLSTSQLGIWWGPELQAHVDLRSRFYGSTFDRLPFHYIVDEMERTLEGHLGEDREPRIGWLMQMHQITLATGGFVDRDAQELIARVNGLEDVLGAKLACGRGRGALVVLTRSNIDRDAFYKRMAELGLERLKAHRTVFEMTSV